MRQLCPPNPPPLHPQVFPLTGRGDCPIFPVGKMFWHCFRCCTLTYTTVTGITHFRWRSNRMIRWGSATAFNRCLTCFDWRFNTDFADWDPHHSRKWFTCCPTAENISCKKPELPNIDSATVFYKLLWIPSRFPCCVFRTCLLTQMQKSVELGNQLDLLSQGKHQCFLVCLPQVSQSMGARVK